MGELPADRAALVAELGRLLGALTAVAEDGPAAEFNRQPPPGKAWSVGQCLDHVAKINRMYTVPLRQAAALARPGPQALRPNNVATGLLVIAAHERRHLLQVQRIREEIARSAS